jgi:hypothetical protein
MGKYLKRKYFLPDGTIRLLLGTYGLWESFLIKKKGEKKGLEMDIHHMENEKDE